MGFTTGFTGGVALTLSVAYISVLAHQRNREHQGAVLRSQALALQGLVDPLPTPLPPTRSEAAASQRLTSIEVAKDRWNHEIDNAVRWAQNTDWDEVRESVEEGASKLWTKAFGVAPEEETGKAKARMEAAKTKVEDAGSGVASAAKEAYSSAKTRTQSVEEAAENKLLEARLRTNKEMSKAEDKATEAKGALASAWDSGKDKARGLAYEARAAAGAAEDKVESKMDGNATPTVSLVEQALRQRYEKPQAKAEKTVAEVLRERYIPIGERDNSVLRGL